MFCYQSGFTPLTLAASKNHNDVIEFLINEANADLNIVDQVRANIISAYIYNYTLKLCGY